MRRSIGDYLPRLCWRRFPNVGGVLSLVWRVNVWARKAYGIYAGVCLPVADGPVGYHALRAEIFREHGAMAGIAKPIPMSTVLNQSGPAASDVQLGSNHLCPGVF